MDMELNSSNGHFTVPLPRIFHSFFHEGPFPECTVCGKALLEDGVSYFIEKAYSRGEVIFEYAMCDECRSGMGEELSFESMMNIAAYFMEHGDLIERRERLMEAFDNSIKEWIEECIFTGRKRAECDSYQICAECEGSNLVVSFMPFMVSGEATEELQNLLSKETKESFDRFTRDVLNPPVDLKNIPILI
jgi:hypothetical protein